MCGVEKGWDRGRGVDVEFILDLILGVSLENCGGYNIKVIFVVFEGKE